MKECLEFEPDTYRNASLQLKTNVELALFFFQSEEDHFLLWESICLMTGILDR